jgi:hypothetical protein
MYSKLIMYYFMSTVNATFVINQSFILQWLQCTVPSSWLTQYWYGVICD